MFLTLENTTIGYHSPLIQSANTTLGLGEVCLLIGNNGTGKTTLIKTILNQMKALNGEILINGINVEKQSTKEIAQQIAVVFSKAVVPNNYTTSDLISLGKYIHYPYYFELSENDKIEVENTIKSLHLSQYKNIPLGKLSDGNLQKAFIGRALTQNSPFIILDEPTTHLDEENKISILQLLRDLAQKHKKLILFSSHDWRLAKDFADKIWYIKDQSLYSGIAEDIISEHAELMHPAFNLHTSSFIAPHIEAPFFQKEMLFSFLKKFQKNDWSQFEFHFEGDFWRIKKDDIYHQFKNFSQISEFFKNYH